MSCLRDVTPFEMQPIIISQLNGCEFLKSILWEFAVVDYGAGTATPVKTDI
jgi:hypothetical protein